MPKAIALIGDLPATLRDRSLKIGLRRKLPKETVEPLEGLALDVLAGLRDRAAAWAAASLARLVNARPAMSPEITNRAANNWRPLLSIADVAGGRWPELARNVAVSTSATDPNIAPGVTLLGDIRTVFQDTKQDRIMTTDLIERLIKMNDRPWGNGIEDVH